MHLLEDDTITSMFDCAMSIGMAPKDDMASTITVRARPDTALQIAAIGLTMPEVVSQWTIHRWLMVRSALRTLTISSGVGVSLSPLSSVTTGRPRRLRIFAARSP